MLIFIYVVTEKVMHNATPNGCLVPGRDDFQIGMLAGGNCHYIIIPFSDEIRRTFAISRIVTAFLVTRKMDVYI